METAAPPDGNDSASSSEPPAESQADSQAGPAEGILGPSYRVLTIGVVTLILMVAFEAMAVTTAMPVAARELHGLALYAWGFSGFMTASMFATIVSGELADRYGPVRPFLAGVGLFVGGLVLTGTAATMGLFIAGRAVQGLGGGALVVSLFVIAGRAYPQQLLPRLMAAFSSAWVLPAIVGPLVAGVLTEQLSWRLVFLGLVPLAVVPLVLMVPRLRQLPSVEPPEPRPGRKRLALAAAVGIAMVQYAGQNLEWWSLLLVVAGLALLVPSLPRLLPPGALRFARGLPTIVVMRGVLAGAFFGMQSFLPLMLKDHRGLTVTLAGLLLTVGALGWSSGSWWQGRSGMKTPRTKLVRVAAMLVTIGVTIVLLVVFTFVPVWFAVPGVLVAGFGMGIGMSSLTVLVLQESPVAAQGANSAAGQLADSLGQVVFIGLGGVLFAGLHQTLTGGVVFFPIFLVMIGVGLTGTVLGRRAVPVPVGASAAP